MKAAAKSSKLLLCCALMVGAVAVKGQDQSTGGPFYAGKALSSWVDGVAALSHLQQTPVNTNYPEVRAVRAIGTNAIPWLLSEMTNQPPSGAGDERPYFHQLRFPASKRLSRTTLQPVCVALTKSG